MRVGTQWLIGRNLFAKDDTAVSPSDRARWGSLKNLIETLEPTYTDITARAPAFYCVALNRMVIHSDFQPPMAEKNAESICSIVVWSELDNDQKAINVSVSHYLGGDTYTWEQATIHRSKQHENPIQLWGAVHNLDAELNGELPVPEMSHSDEQYVSWPVLYMFTWMFARGGIALGAQTSLELWLVTIRISAEISATLTVRGPPMATVHIGFWVFAFNVNFSNLNDSLVLQIAQTVRKESRAFGNGNHTKDVLQAQRYVLHLDKGLQGATGSNQKQVITTCKHYAVYDAESNRNGQNYNPTQQDLGELYFSAFKTCVRDAGVGSIMCSYNAVNGVPSCANEYLLKTVLREHWGSANQPYHYITGDYDAVNNIWHSHKFVDSAAAAAAVAINAGTDSDCGYNGFAYNPNLMTAANKTWITEAKMDQALTRLYTGLFTVGYFDCQSQYDSLGWQDGSTGDAQQLAYTSAAAGIGLLKNNGALPIQSAGSKKIALMVLELTQPLKCKATTRVRRRTKINTADTSGFSDATTAASKSDVIIFCGGIDTSIEAEGFDLSSITWPGNQLDLISSLSKLGKPLVVVQFGGGQIDDSAQLSNPNSLIRLLVSIFDPNVRPSSDSPGRTYKWYTGKPVLPFGYGLHYTNFSTSTASTLKSTYDIASLVASAKNDASTFETLTVAVNNTSKVTSDYVAIMFVSTKDGGPSPYPNKSLVSYARAKSIGAGQTKSVDLTMSLGSIARASGDGDLVL
ncbi:hypothetical protein IL306_007247 [Fusarium sp. DS 682]|nr:hypothetical protein IL306_007247 [Fusarium sp. DS 682]